MARLIDADKLNELEYEDDYGCKCVSMYDIDEQPTAYSVDKVIKELEAARNSIEIRRVANSYSKGLYDGITIAIKIINVEFNK